MKRCLVAGVLILSKDGKKVLLLKHRKLGIWVYPGGHLEKNENLLECAIREAKEETKSKFNIISTSSIRIRAKGAKSLPQPLIILDEDVPYKKAHHRHFDIIYLGVARSMEFRQSSESTACRWFGREEIDGLKTFGNVKKVIKYGFETYDAMNKKQ